MSAVPDITLGGVTLPGDMLWIDEHTGWRRGQDVQTSITGALIVQEASRQAGRPITLATQQSGNSLFGSLTYAQVEAVQALIDAGGTYTLVLPAWPVGTTRSFTVRFDQNAPIESTAARHVVPASPDDWWYRVTLRMFTV